MIEADQEIPPGLHLRLNLETGVREGKINVPGEGEEYEAVAVELPPGGGSGSVVVVGGEEAPAPSNKLPPPNDDPYGAIKVPVTAQSEELPFTDAVSVILDSKAFSDSKLNDALSSLEGLVHEMYWGLQISTPKNVKALLHLVHTSTNPSVRKSAALVIGNALQNNPKALKNAIGREATKTGESAGVRLVETLLVALQHETDDSARLRMMYALSQSIKSEHTYEDFIKIGGLQTLLELFVTKDTDAGMFKGKVSTFVEDNFLDDDMQSEPKTKTPEKKQLWPGSQRTQQILQKTNDRYTLSKSVIEFAGPFQEALIHLDKNDATSDDVKIKILNALVALQIKFHLSAFHKPLSEEFIQWFQTRISGEQNVEKLEEDGQWFKIRALEVKDVVIKS